MGFFDFLFGGAETTTEDELKAKESLPIHEMYCSRCKHIIGGSVDGFYCSLNCAWSTWTKNGDTYEIGMTRDDIRKPCCEGNSFVPRHPTDPKYDDDITNF